MEDTVLVEHGLFNHDIKISCNHDDHDTCVFREERDGHHAERL